MNVETAHGGAVCEAEDYTRGSGVAMRDNGKPERCSVMPRPGIEPGPSDLQSDALPTELSRLGSEGGARKQPIVLVAPAKISKPPPKRRRRTEISWVSPSNRVPRTYGRSGCDPGVCTNGIRGTRKAELAWRLGKGQRGTWSEIERERGRERERERERQRGRKKKRGGGLAAHQPKRVEGGQGGGAAPLACSPRKQKGVPESAIV